MLIKLKQESFFIGLNLIVLIEILLALRGRFYLRTHGVSNLPPYATIMVTAISILLTLFSLWIARSLIVKEISFNQTKLKLIVLSVLFGCGLSGILLAIDEIMKFLM